MNELMSQVFRDVSGLSNRHLMNECGNVTDTLTCFLLCSRVSKFKQHIVNYVYLTKCLLSLYIVFSFYHYFVMCPLGFSVLEQQCLHRACILRCSRAHLLTWQCDGAIRCPLAWSVLSSISISISIQLNTSATQVREHADINQISNCISRSP